MRAILKIATIGILTVSAVRAQDAAKPKTVTDQVRHFAAAVTEELKANRELLKKMSADMELLQNRMQHLQREVTKLSLENSQLKKIMENQAKQHKAELAAERKVRALNDQKIVKELTAVMSEGNAQPKPDGDQTTDAGRRHKVRPGDTLSVIAKAYQTSVKQIMLENNLKNTNIRVGQLLVIPE